ncbi:hypothetical protein C8E95_7106 [Pseudonocardia autotrophica]|uniref:WD40-like Beta Propeller Repeat protein n=3 Tax=Pseudonocardiaceae TaxID=2070 RepID=A0A1Y2MIE8_PSEAH|nr:hypothetical protein BG845_06346 [Pseudonocardia autotrophica]TDN65600.1 hypothetical protein C8E95_7106 [Pseudonocardia autotrophica]BBG05742.1 hypothetical protein Pdca_69510 [Pseudonocardia autotrophica]GEC28152.1 hypothetical protein PSA01_51810 [Pseudonocardia saturnea]
MGMNRRMLLRRSGQLGLGVSLFGSVQALLCAPAAAAPAAVDVTGYGPLIDDPAGRLALPEGFSYRVVTEAGQTRTYEGEPSPGVHDGAAAFAADDGNVLIVLNHEVRGGPDDDGAVPHENGLVYRDDAGGGCTIIKTTAGGELLWETVGIAGTSTNCAGGVTPWDTWLTCEETEDDGHGWVFEVDPHDLDANRDPEPITTLGRFRHEALCVDPDSLAIYLTEDAEGPNGTVYRWRPPSGFRGRSGELKQLGTADGEFAALSCTDGDGAVVDDLARADAIDTVYTVEWVSVEDRAAENGSLRSAEGITRAAKLEGAWWADDGAYVVSSYAEDHRGQVWFYDPAESTLRLTTVFATEADGETVEAPDNIVAAGYGGLIVATDGDGDNHLAGITPDGDVYPIARSQMGSEFTGPAFSPDGAVLFAGIQKPGVLFAITGPWQQRSPPSGTGSSSPGSTNRSGTSGSSEGSGSNTDSTGRRGPSRARDQRRWRRAETTSTPPRTSRSSR